MKTNLNDYQRNALGPICTHTTCPHRDNCLRHLLADDIMEEGKGDVAFCVLPSNLHPNGHCSMFRSSELLPMGYGLAKFYDDMPYRKGLKIRQRMKDLLGGRSMYYHYYCGEYPFTPLMQERIKDMFKRQGYDGPLNFERVKMEPDWHSPHSNDIDA